MKCCEEVSDEVDSGHASQTKKSIMRAVVRCSKGVLLLPTMSGVQYTKGCSWIRVRQ